MAFSHQQPATQSSQSKPDRHPSNDLAWGRHDDKNGKHRPTGVHSYPELTEPPADRTPPAKTLRDSKQSNRHTADDVGRVTIHSYSPQLQSTTTAHNCKRPAGGKTRNGVERKSHDHSRASGVSHHGACNNHLQVTEPQRSFAASSPSTAYPSLTVSMGSRKSAAMASIPGRPRSRSSPYF